MLGLGMARGADMIDILSIIPPLLIAAVVSFVVAMHERRRGETSQRWKARCGQGTRSSCVYGTYLFRGVFFIIPAVCRHITDKTGN